MRKVKTQKRGFPKKVGVGSSTTKPMQAGRAGKSSAAPADLGGLMADAMASATGRGTIASGKKMDLKDTSNPRKKKATTKSGTGVNRFRN